MKIEIYGKPDFWFSLSDGQMAVLERLSGLHYDGVCKAATRVGGFIYGWKNARDVAYKMVSVSASFREIDTCLKILEGLQMPPADMTIGQVAIGQALAASFRVALSKANEVTKSWSTEIEA